MLKPKKVLLKSRLAVGIARSGVVRDPRGKQCRRSSSHPQTTGGWAQGLSHRSYLEQQHCLLHRGRQQKIKSGTMGIGWLRGLITRESVSSVISFDLSQLGNELLASDDFSVLHVKWVDRFIHFSTGDDLPEIQDKRESSAIWIDRKNHKSITPQSSGTFEAKSCCVTGKDKDFEISILDTFSRVN